jgi:hypothetical protein
MTAAKHPRPLARDKRREAINVIRAMEAGASLHLTFGKANSYWELSNGKKVASDVALMVVNDLRVVGVGDSLFQGASSQTWRAAEP